MALTVPAYTVSESVGTTEHSMTTDTAGPDTDTTDGVYQAFIRTPAAAVRADVFEWAVYETIGGTQVKTGSAVLVGTGAETGWTGPALTLGVGWDMTLKKISGTDRTLVGHINKVA
jgi:hypothetical protein